MPVSANTVWEVRVTGSSTNGAGFVTGASGVDYSQQDAAQYALTGVTSAGAGDTVLTASASSDMVGNVARCVSGTNFTAGYFQIISVVPGVSITFSTQQSGTSICTGVGANGVINIGGATDLPSRLGFVLTAGNVMFIKQGTFPKTSTETINQSSSADDATISIVGYDTTRTVGANSDTKPVFTSATNSVAIFTIGASLRIKFYNIRVTHTAATRGLGWTYATSNSNGIQWENCECDGCSSGWTTGTGLSVQLQRAVWINCVSRNCTINGWTDSTGTGEIIYANLIGCMGIDNAQHGFSINSNAAATSSFLFVNCIFANNGADGINTASTTLASNLYVNGCVFFGNTNSGIRSSVTTSLATAKFHVTNSIFYGNIVFGIQFNTADRDKNPGIILRSNAYGANGADTSNVVDTIGKVSLTSDPFIDSASDNFNMNFVSGGGLAVKDTGFPSTIGTNTYNSSSNKLDIGAVQSILAAGGAGPEGGRLIGG